MANMTHRERLLAAVDRQCDVLPGLVDEGRRHEKLPWHTLHRVQDTKLGDAAVPQFEDQARPVIRVTHSNVSLSVLSVAS